MKFITIATTVFVAGQFGGAVALPDLDVVDVDVEPTTEVESRGKPCPADNAPDQHCYSGIEGVLWPSNSRVCHPYPHMGDDEVVYQDWEARQSSIKTRSSYYKIEGAIGKAKKDSLEWLWVDTVCIDKASSAELTEDINSMYEWYKNATICYAYMADVPPLNEADHDPFRKFQNSRWFRRGWTLQELIAPSTLLFFSAQWTRIGTRSGRIAEIVSSVTGIELDILTGESTLASASVAKKMSWLSKRTTTRIEDIAYCMLGIFDVNMPLLYGEGMKAFVRLQEEIIKVSNDHTIFCWEWDDSVPGGWVNMLAPSPTTFSNSGGYEPREDVGTLVPYSHYKPGPLDQPPSDIYHGIPLR
ncbi:putative Heterokaryon incompatibility domain-containing protein [Seiridium unicorne]|uniref:Heterokaryon incompatibility domain-containing protein n=1 Tax=Seiridium unicorne TaxID=138068 RepID=A0ABR2V9X9_9PEZI